MKNHFRLILQIIFFFMGVSILPWQDIYTAFQLNQVYLRAVYQLLENDSPLAFQTDDITKEITKISICRKYWIEASLAKQMGDTSRQVIALEQSIRCDPHFILFTRFEQPTSIDLAEFAVQQYPNSAAGWIWSANLIEVTDPELAINYYTKGLNLSPKDKKAWLALARLLEKANRITEANVTYESACVWGDYGSHACLRAGNLAASQGDFTNAIVYYLSSSLPQARQKGMALLRSRK